MTTATLLHLRRAHLIAMVDAFEEGNTMEAQVISRSLTFVNRKLAKRGLRPPALPIGLLTTPAKTQQEQKRIERAIDHACEISA